MKSTEQKAKFIELRAKGLSYSKIAKQLRISKSTCTSWERELKVQIKEAKEDRLNELYELYAMNRESRIKRMGETLANIDKAIESKDLKELPADVLLKLKLSYEEKLKAEYSEPDSGRLTDFTFDGLIEAIADIYRGQQNGDIEPAQAKAQLATIENIVSIKKLKDASSPFFDFDLAKCL